MTGPVLVDQGVGGPENVEYRDHAAACRAVPVAPVALEHREQAGQRRFVVPRRGRSNSEEVTILGTTAPVAHALPQFVHRRRPLGRASELDPCGQRPDGGFLAFVQGQARDDSLRLVRVARLEQQAGELRGQARVVGIVAPGPFEQRERGVDVATGGELRRLLSDAIRSPGDVPVEQFTNDALRLKPQEMFHHARVLVEHHRGQAANAVIESESMLAFRVHLRQQHCAPVLRDDFAEDGSEGTAGPAPFGPEINQNRGLPRCLQDPFRKGVLVGIEYVGACRAHRVDSEQTAEQFELDIPLHLGRPSRALYRVHETDREAVSARADLRVALRAGGKRDSDHLAMG